MSTDLAVVDDLKREQLELVKQTVARGCSDTELQLFLYTAKRTGLDPLLRQIHAVKRWDSNLQKEVMAIQTGIDGYRLVADRTGNYAPGARPTYTYKKDGALNSAVASVRKKTADGEWHTIEAEAFFDEYVQTRKDGKPNNFWATKPHIMLAKCAESLALRKAFPAELSGLYTHEEMEQADSEKPAKPQGSLRDRVMAQAKPITMPEARQIAMEALETAERERKEFAEHPADGLATTVPVVAEASTPETPPVAAGEEWRYGFVVGLTKAEKLTKKNQPWGTITFKLDGNETVCNWFGFSGDWDFESVHDCLLNADRAVRYVLREPTNPKYLATLEKFAPEPLA